MIIKNKLDKSFGPVGTSAGSLLLVAGLIITYTSFFGLVLVLLGAFVGFSSTSTYIDFEKKRIKFSNNLFGIIQTGKWISIEKTMKVGLKVSNMTWSAHSRGNRTIDINTRDFRLALFDTNNLEIIEIKKFDSLDSAKVALETLSSKLGLVQIDYL